MATTAAKITTGRRKEAVARVRLTPGTGNFDINGRSLDDYFPTRVHRMVAVSALRLVGREKDFDVIVTIRGGGIAGHAILKTLCGYDPSRFVSMQGRFASPVYPGETIRTEMWRDGNVVSFRCTVAARGATVLNNGRAEIR